MAGAFCLAGPDNSFILPVQKVSTLCGLSGVDDVRSFGLMIQNRTGRNQPNPAISAGAAKVRLVSKRDIESNDLIYQCVRLHRVLRVRLRIHRCAIRRSSKLPMATWIIASETSRRFS